MPGTMYEGRVVILTAVEVEFLAVLEHLIDTHEVVYQGSIYETGHFVTEKWSWSVSVAQIGAGNPTAAAAVERAITKFRPEIILFVGVAGGVKDVRIGDVVAVTKAYGYESGKVHETGFLARPEVGISSFRLVERAKAEARKKNWLRRIPGYPDLPTSEPRAFVGPIAAGEKVIASTKSELFDFLQRVYNDTLAIEMEGRGFLQAAHTSEHVLALIIRGISDLLNNKSTSDAQGSQESAARHAAAFAFEMLAQLDVPELASLLPASQGSTPVRQELTRPISSRAAISPTHQDADAFASAKVVRPIQLYYSFAPVREDEALVKQFAKQLAVLRDQKRITEWDRSKVLPGQVVQAEVTKHLTTAHIFLLFISPDYITTQECQHDMQRAIERQRSNGAIVIPILLRPVALLQEMPFAHLERFPKNGRSLVDLGNRKAAAFAEIADVISAMTKDVT